MGYNNRILIVDDNKELHRVIKTILLPRNIELSTRLLELEQDIFGIPDEFEENQRNNERIFEIESAFSGNMAYDMVRDSLREERPYALIFMDVRMPPGRDGIETIARIWEIYTYVEIVICTAFTDYSWENIVNRLGPTDKLLFLKKPFTPIVLQQLALTLVNKWNYGNRSRIHLQELEREVEARTKQLQIMLGDLQEKNTKLTKSQQELKLARQSTLALEDAQTGLIKRIVFIQQLEQFIALATRHKYSLAILRLDLDDLKHLNERYGEHVHNQVMLEITERLSNCLRSCDSMVRIYEGNGNANSSANPAKTGNGSQELTIVLTRVNQINDSLVVANRISQALKNDVVIGEHSYTPGCSIGITRFPDDGEEPGILLEKADRAMILAQQQGGNRYHFYSNI